MEIAIPGFHLPMTAASGQCFRFDRLEDGDFSLIAHGRQLLIRDLGSGAFELSCSQEEFESLWRGYFDLDRDYSQVHGLVAPDGGYLHRAVEFAKGVRILRQHQIGMLQQRGQQPLVLRQRVRVRRIHEDDLVERAGIGSDVYYDGALVQGSDEPVSASCRAASGKKSARACTPSRRLRLWRPRMTRSWPPAAWATG